jgi:hypothetical protein
MELLQFSRCWRLLTKSVNSMPSIKSEGTLMCSQELTTGPRWIKQVFTNSSSFRSVLILSRVRSSMTSNNRLWTGWLDLLTPFTFTQFGTADNTALSLFYTLYSLPLHTH